MSNGVEDFDESTAAARRAALIRRARVEGVEVAYQSALEICRDPKAPAAAKASSQRTLLDVGGMLDRRDREEQKGKEIHEMTAEELQREVEVARRRISELKRKPGVFD